MTTKTKAKRAGTEGRMRTVQISAEAAQQLEALRVRSGHEEAEVETGLTQTVKWLIRAKSDAFARIDRENAADRKSAEMQSED